MNRPTLAGCLERMVEGGRLFAGRLRAAILRLRGAKLGARVSIGPGCRVDRPWCFAMGRSGTVEAGVWIKIVDDEARVECGEFSFLGRGVELDVKERLDIGSHALIAPGCFLTDHGHSLASNRRIDEQTCPSRPVIIGSDAWLGARVIVLPGVTIGEGAVVGAGAVVDRAIPSMGIAVGVPARVVGSRREEAADV